MPRFTYSSSCTIHLFSDGKGNPKISIKPSEDGDLNMGNALVKALSHKDFIEVLIRKNVISPSNGKEVEIILPITVYYSIRPQMWALGEMAGCYHMEAALPQNDQLYISFYNILKLYLNYIMPAYY